MRLVPRKLAWISVVKPVPLFVLPLPLLVATVGAMIGGDVTGVAITGGALASFWSAGALAFRGLVEETRYRLGERLFPAPFPWKRLSVVPTALGSALAATSAGHDPTATLLFAGLAGLGHLAFIGTDPARRRITITQVEGAEAAGLERQLEQGHARLRALHGAGRSLALPEFRQRVGRIARIGEGIFVEIERDPALAPRARRFLNLYLAEAERVTGEYGRTQRRGQNAALEDNFRRLLVEMESTFSDQHRLLRERKELLLDADIEVLNSRLTNEGPG